MARLKEFRPVLFHYSPKEAFHRKSCNLFMESLQLLELVFETMLERNDGMTPERHAERKEQLRRCIFALERFSPLTVSARRLFTHWSDFLA